MEYGDERSTESDLRVGPQSSGTARATHGVGKVSGGGAEEGGGGGKEEGQGGSAAEGGGGEAEGRGGEEEGRGGEAEDTPWTFRNKLGKSDAAHTKRASECKPIKYPPFEPLLSTDLLTSVALTGTNHAEDQPMHLRVRRYLTGGGDAGAEGRGAEKGVAAERFVEDADVRREHVRVNVGEYAGLLGRGCPAQVYEYVDAEEAKVETAGQVENVGWGGKKLVINSQNCKFCDVKVPTQDIT
ncbi:hypothetical protein PYCCODRAFT_1422287 [Trametes coccinea BRFM310]|uniref:Electron transfer flavoprotein-ubiquinone oxidoreductase n=1 Tax=Trametes coccinea (strain BRFM310) TaxID=1353009 RepID=A0A1Y2J2J8_TRAC3|nr:hypothetical protein PYCCODRAFT_1422287 [Trametes coccinea BRFM310]